MNTDKSTPVRQSTAESNSSKVAPEVMAELLDKPGVKEFVVKMTPNELEWYKELLVVQGIYGQYCMERENDI